MIATNVFLFSRRNNNKLRLRPSPPLLFPLHTNQQVPKKALMKIGLDGDLAAALVTDLVRCGVRIERGTTVASFDLGAAAGGGGVGNGKGGLLVDPSGVTPLKIHLDSGKVRACA